MTAPDESNPVSALLRKLPAVDFLLRQPAIATLLDEFSRAELTRCIRLVLERRRAEVLAGRTPALQTHAIALDVRQLLYARTLPHLRRVINATGIVLHTGLGRAPLADAALEAINAVAAGYCNLELDLETGRRGDRHDHLRDLLRELTGAEDALVVNNNAAGTYLTLHALAAGRRVIVSRGQLVEIGGSYRMPDIMAAAGCEMVEVGTTNRTHLADYERVIDEQTAVLLRVHTSNYRIEGFTAAPSVADLAALARKSPRLGLAVVDDLGSGMLDRFEFESAAAGQQAASAVDWDEPTVRDSVSAGADVTLFSGDKLLGGPQAGIILGRTELIERMRRSPLARTFRPDKLTLAGLEATLRLYRDPDGLVQQLPVYRLLRAGLDEIEARARTLADGLADRLPEADICCEADESFAGGGTLPTVAFPTRVVSLRAEGCEPQRLAAGLRKRSVPIIVRLRHDALIFDCRTILREDLEQIPAAVAECLRELCEESAPDGS